MRKSNEKTKKGFIASGVLLLLFVLFTIAVQFIDVAPIGPRGSSVGFSTLNGKVHNLLGVHMTLYNITDWLGLVPIIFVLGFAVLGLIQLIKRKSLLRVDTDILILGLFYIVVFGAYLFFEFYVVNYRPILIENVLEASYPSSTTMLTMCVILTAILQFKQRIRNKSLELTVNTILGIFAIFMVVGRLISGVHWFTDIIAGMLLSTAFVFIYNSVVNVIAKKATVGKEDL